MISMDRAHLYWAYLKARADDSAVFVLSFLFVCCVHQRGPKKILANFCCTISNCTEVVQKIFCLTNLLVLYAIVKHRTWLFSFY